MNKLKSLKKIQEERKNRIKERDEVDLKELIAIRKKEEEERLEKLRLPRKEEIEAKKYGIKEKEEVEATKYGIKEKAPLEGAKIGEYKIEEKVSKSSEGKLQVGEIKAKKYGIKEVRETKIIGQGDMKILLPYEVKEIIKLKIFETLNTHGSLKLQCIIDDSVYENILNSIRSGKSVKVYSKDKSIFVGSITGEKLRCVKEVYYLEIEAKSFTYELDIRKNTRIFPSGDMSYKDIIDYVLKGYSKVNYLGNLTKKPKGIVVQYRETDFEFIKRLASKENLSLLPDSSYESPRFKIGGIENVQAIKIENTEYSVIKNIDKLNRINSTREEEISEQKFICYSFKSVIPLKLGDKIILNGDYLYINKVEGEIKDSILEYRYTLGKIESLMEKKIFNENITGASFKASVTSINKDEMKVKFNMDRNTESIYLKYLTPFSLESGYGWYIMPEVGDAVTVQFSNENEENAYILSSNKMSGGGDSSTKSLSTPYGKSMTLNSSSINFSGGGGSVTVGNGDITIKSPNDITLDASNNFKINGSNVSMSGGEITQLIGPGSSIILDGDINGHGGEVIV